jgi:ferrous iron transport protein B
VQDAVAALVEQLQTAFPALPNARWVALRLLDGDRRIIQAVRDGEIGELSRSGADGETAANEDKQSIALEVVA